MRGIEMVNKITNTMDFRIASIGKESGRYGGLVRAAKNYTHAIDHRPG